MDKKNKIIIIVISCLIVLLIGVGIYLFFSYGKETSKEIDFGEIPEEYLDYTDVEPEEFTNKVEVIEYINSYILYDNNYALFEYEDENCWYFRGSDGSHYSYCGNGTEINVIK